MVIGTSQFLRQYSHGKDMNYIAQSAIEVIEFVKSKGIDCYSLDYGKKILSSDSFLEYVKSIGIPINGNSYRITSQDIENFIF